MMDIDELQKIFDDLKRKVPDLQAQREYPCPSCGRCPTCGRGAWPNGTWEWRPTQPHPFPPVVYYLNDDGTISSNSFSFHN